MNDPQPQESSHVSRSLKFIATFGVGLTTAASVVSDVLTPLAPLALYFFIAAFLLLLASVMMYWSKPACEKCSKVFGEIWYAPIGITLGLSAAIFLGTYLLGASEDSDSGALANHFPAIKKMQSDLDLVAKNTGRIAIATENIDINTQKISGKMDNVKREVSENPRKELANLGISWNPENFLLAVRQGELETTKLFLDGGMKFQSLSLPIELSHNMIEPEKMLALLQDYGLDVNKIFVTGDISGPKTTTLLYWAIANNNPRLITALAKSGADLNGLVETFEAYGMTGRAIPLVLAVRGSDWSLASLLISLGADPTRQDYAAYRIAKDQALKMADKAPPELQKLVKELAPPGNSSIGLEVQQKFDAANRAQQIAKIKNDINLINLKLISKGAGPFNAKEEREVMAVIDQHDKLSAELQKLQSK